MSSITAQGLAFHTTDLKSQVFWCNTGTCPTMTVHELPIKLPTAVIQQRYKVKGDGKF